MKDRMCQCPKCGFKANESEFIGKDMMSSTEVENERNPKKNVGLSVYLISDKEDEGTSEEENA